MKFLFMLILLVVSSHAAAQVPSDSPEPPLYRPNSTEAALVGTIHVVGPIPEPLVIDMSADPVCIDLDRRPEVDWLLINQNRLVNAFVYVTGEMLQAYRFEMPASEAVLQQKQCRYVPHVLGIRVGQALQIINSDPTIHNVHPTPKLNREWNQTHPPQSPPIVKTFNRTEVLIPFKDNQHPWEKAYVGVLNHPFFAVSDEFGRFEIRGLPPGTYKLTVWHEKLGEQQLDVTLLPNEIRSADFTFSTEKKP